MKKFLKIFGIILLVAATALDVWFLAVYFTAPDKIVQHTYNVSPMTTSNETDTKTFVEVNYMSNENGNGLELFEIKFNYFMDEEKESFYSQGLQYVTNTKTGEITWNYMVNDEYGHHDEVYDNRVIMIYHDRDLYGSYYAGSETEQYQYMSDDDYNSTMMTTNPIDNKTYFTIQIGEDLYKMQFKGIENAEDLEHIGTEMMAYSEWKGLWTNWYNYQYYVAEDVNTFAYIMYNSVKGMSSGTNANHVFEFSDMFNYYKYDSEQGAYSETTEQGEGLLKVQEHVTNYYVVKTTVSDNGAKVSSDSIFNSIRGNTAFSLTGEYSEEGYFYGMDCVSVDLYDFDYLLVDGNSYVLALKDEFKEYYETYKYSVVLDIEIDLDALSEKNIEFLGIDASSFEDFSIYECTTTQLVNGELVESEVAYV